VLHFALFVRSKLMMASVAPYRSNFSSRLSQPSAMDRWQRRVDKEHYLERKRAARRNVSRIDHFISSRVNRPSPPTSPPKQKNRSNKRRKRWTRERQHRQQQTMVERDILKAREGRGGWIFASDPIEYYPRTRTNNSTFLVPTPPTLVHKKRRRKMNGRRRKLRPAESQTLVPQQEVVATPNRVMLQSLTRKINRYSRDASKRRKRDNNRMIMNPQPLLTQKPPLPILPPPLKVRLNSLKLILLPVM